MKINNDDCMSVRSANVAPVRSGTKILRLREVCTRLGVSRSSVYNWINIKSQWHIPEFPKPIRIGRSAIGWHDAEIEQYLASRAQGSGK